MTDQTIELEVGESKQVTFEATPKAAGTYQVSVNGLNGNFIVLEVQHDVNVVLKNPPSGANYWGLTLYDWSGQNNVSKTVYTIDGEAVFDIPTDWEYPLRFWISIIYYPNGSITTLHKAQSLSTDWSNYVEEYIPERGSYYYNVNNMMFEPM